MSSGPGCCGFEAEYAKLLTQIIEVLIFWAENIPPSAADPSKAEQWTNNAISFLSKIESGLGQDLGLRGESDLETPVATWKLKDDEITHLVNWADTLEKSIQKVRVRPPGIR